MNEMTARPPGTVRPLFFSTLAEGGPSSIRTRSIPPEVVENLLNARA